MVKCAILLLECRWGALISLPAGCKPVGGNRPTTIVCDARPVRRQTYDYLYSLRWYQIYTDW